MVTIYKSPNTILATIYKTQYYFGNYLQKPNTILVIIYKRLNITLATFYQKPKTIGQTIILPKPKYYLAKELYYAQNLKLFFSKNIF